MNNVIECSEKFTNLSATGTVFTGRGLIIGIIVASASSGTVKVQDGAAIILNTSAVTAGQFIPLPTAFNASLVITIGGSADVTVFWTPM